MPVARGWLGYYRLVEDRRLFLAVDRLVVHELRRWLWVRLRNPRRRARVLVRRGLLPTAARSLVACGRPADIAVESPAFRRAYPVSWLRARGWTPLGEATPAIVCARERSVENHFPPSADNAALGEDVRLAARRCDLYDFQAPPPSPVSPDPWF